MRHFTTFLFSTLLFVFTLPGLVVGQQTVPPAALQVQRDGFGPESDHQQARLLSALNEGDAWLVYETCTTDQYRVAFQLEYTPRSASDWQALSVELALEKPAVDGLGTTEVFSQVLTVSQSPQVYVTTVFYDQEIRCSENYRVRFKTTTAEGTVNPDDFSLKVLRFPSGQLSDTPPGFDAATANIDLLYTDGELRLSWPEMPGALEYDLEWLYLETLYDEQGNEKPHTAEQGDFEAATRVTVGRMDYRFRPVYPKGRLYFRVRGATYYSQNRHHRITGNWLYHCEEPLDSLPEWAFLAIDNPQPDLNWQGVSTYAEAGKSKQVVSYYDGSLRSRQTVTNLNSIGQTLVAESMYDFEGRASVNILPVPAGDNSLNFRPDFNGFASTGIDPEVAAVVGTDPVHPYHYDNDIEYNSPLDPAKGASRYYSPNNPGTSKFRDYIPDAEGFPYTQAVYTLDNTGRVRAQSGVGEVFKTDHDVNRTTRYFYGGAAAAELYRLFGGNVGHASHYRKNMVVDPNGQSSISYTDQEGRTIATALAGDPPAGMDGLESYEEAKAQNEAMTVSLMANNRKGGQGSVLYHKILNVAPTTYHFEYDMSAEAASFEVKAGEEPVCQDCIYDLKIRITNVRGVPVDLYPGASSCGGSIPAQQEIVIEDLLATCESPLGSQTLQFAACLGDAGEYTLTKELVLRDTRYEELRTRMEEKYVVEINELKNEIDQATNEATQYCAPDSLTEEEEEAYLEEALGDFVQQECGNVLARIQAKYTDANGQVDETAVQQDPSYCEYLYCNLMEESKTWEGKLYTVTTLTAAQNKGYLPWTNDPFFQQGGAGYAWKGEMEQSLNQIEIKVSETLTLSGTLAGITDPAGATQAGKAFFVNQNYEHDPAGGKHILYLETAVSDYDKQSLDMYRNLYLMYRRKLISKLIDQGDLQYQGVVLNCEGLKNQFRADLAMFELKPDQTDAWLDEQLSEQQGGTTEEQDQKDDESRAQAYTLHFMEECEAVTEANRAEVEAELILYFQKKREAGGAGAVLPGIIRQEDLNSGELDALKALLGECGVLEDIAIENAMEGGCVLAPLTEPDATLKAKYIAIQQQDMTARKASVEADGQPELVNSSTQTTEFSSEALLETSTANELGDWFGFERRALINLYTEMNGDLWNWDKVPESKRWKNADGTFKTRLDDSWYGVTLSEGGDVITINLRWMGVTGPLSARIRRLKNLKKLYLSHNHITSIPDEIQGLTSLQVLELNENKLTSLPEVVGNLSSLHELQLYGNGLTSLPENIVNLSNNLRILNLGKNSFTSFPEEIISLTGLQYLNLSGNQLTSIPGEIINLTRLGRLFLANNQLTSLPGEFINLTTLYELSLADNPLSVFPTEILSLVNLKLLNLTNTQLTGLPEEIASLTKLQSLHLSDNPLSVFPKGLLSLLDLVGLHLSNTQLTSLPEEFINLIKLRVLNLSDNSLSVFPTELLSLLNLERLNLSNTQLTSLPEEIGILTKLRELYLYVNQLTSLPEEIGNLIELRYLYLNENQLTSIPEEIGNLIELQYLLLDKNQLTSLPVLENLTKLSHFYLRSNHLTFEDLYNSKVNFSSIGYLYYNNQGEIQLPKEQSEYLIGEGRSLILTIDADQAVPNIHYQWFKLNSNGVPVALFPTPKKEDANCYIPGFSPEDVGLYLCKITNSDLPQLTLQTSLVEVSQGICTDYTFNEDAFGLKLLTDKTLAQLEEEQLVACQNEVIAQGEITKVEVVNRYLEEKLSLIARDFAPQCLANLQESFQYTYTPSEYHYTLYYYDQSGSLTQTVPPEGVEVLSAAEVNQLVSASEQGQTLPEIYPAHRLKTRYQYNSLGQLVWQNTPDGGSSRFWYDDKGQLRFSQNAKQKANNHYSYTRYDAHGRILEVGQLEEATAGIFDPAVVAALNETDENGTSLYPLAGSVDYALTEMTRTHYDKAREQAAGETPYNFTQQNLRNRVAWVETLEDGQTRSSLTLYDYDEHGNVRALLQDLQDLGAKRTDYVYDLVSGNVNYVFYQYGEAEQFAHRYRYDDDNRIISVETSTDRFVWQKEAGYEYYAHGPLARVSLGEYSVQGLDYYYTLQGWIKGVNRVGDPAGDPGQDGAAQSPFAPDEFAYSLGYFEGDYKPIGLDLSQGADGSQLWSRYKTMYQTQRGLYNGNISWMVTDLPEIGRQQQDAGKGLQAMLYRYDQLNRIRKARSLSEYAANSAWESRTHTQLGAYDADYRYDANGNLLQLMRRETPGTNVKTTEYNYQYQRDGNGHLLSNRLLGIGFATSDETEWQESWVQGNSPLQNQQYNYQYITLQQQAKVASGESFQYKAGRSLELLPDFEIEAGGDFTAEIGALTQGQQSGNWAYEYDEIGNLIKDANEGIDRIEWTVYGKVAKVVKGEDFTEYRYDASGNRVYKGVKVGTTTKMTHYVRDASGNVMAIYKDQQVSEQPVYGSSRVGLFRRSIQPEGQAEESQPQAGELALGHRQYELSNHLGNVLATITDRVKYKDNRRASEVLSASDYFPFGKQMAGRNYSDESYRYGFNGKENDKDFGNQHLIQDYGFRLYNPEIGKFLSVDPLTKSYPELTPYQFASNTPIYAIDLDGLEAWVNTKSNNDGSTTLTLIIDLDVKNSTTNFSNKTIMQAAKGVKKLLEQRLKAFDLSENTYYETIVNLKLNNEASFDNNIKNESNDFYLDYVSIVDKGGKKSKWSAGWTGGNGENSDYWIGNTDFNRFQVRIDEGDKFEELYRTGSHEVGHGLGLRHEDSEEFSLDGENLLRQSVQTSGTNINIQQIKKVFKIVAGEKPSNAGRFNKTTKRRKEFIEEKSKLVPKPKDKQN
ncbi:leucine-rich repeat domain-containing protein [Rapidithrix thailandica]|uniref:Leucine-rich repeat domain-containing protein n=1 Tax=Rapidithrix thailandica TaxID=413964 RepID=A0AAW9SH04_9BACT